MSKLDPEMYGHQESALKEEHILAQLNGMTVQQVLLKILDNMTENVLSPNPMTYLKQLGPYTNVVTSNLSGNRGKQAVYDKLSRCLCSIC